MEKLNLTQEWDKVFPKSDKVDHKKVTFHNRYGITLKTNMKKIISIKKVGNPTFSFT